MSVVVAICVIMSLVFVVNASDDNLTITETEGFGAFWVLKSEDHQVFCVEENKPHPTVGVEYTATSYNVEGIERVFAAYHVLYNNSYDFEAAGVAAVWDVSAGGSDKSGWLIGYVGTQESLQYYAEIMELAKTINPSDYGIGVTVKYYAADGYQTIAVFDVYALTTDTTPDPTEDTTPDPTEDTTPDPDPTPDPNPGPSDEEDVEDTTPNPDPEPDPQPQPEPETQPDVQPDPEPEGEETNPPETDPEPDPEILDADIYYPDPPKTGDVGSTIFVFLMIASLFGIAFITFLKKKGEK